MLVLLLALLVLVLVLSFPKHLTLAGGTAADASTRRTRPVSVELLLSIGGAVEQRRRQLLRVELEQT